MPIICGKVMEPVSHGIKLGCLGKRDGAVSIACGYRYSREVS